MRIQSVQSREILASGGTPTVETRVTLQDGSVGIASVPFGASAGVHEAAVLFDKDNRYAGKGMQQAVKTVETVLQQCVQDQSVEELPQIDARMRAADGTENLSKLGGNAVLSVSLACARAGSVSANESLHAWLCRVYKTDGVLLDRMPYPMMVLLEGGKHADRSTDMQEYLVVPHAAPTVVEAVRWGQEVMQALKFELADAGFSGFLWQQVWIPPRSASGLP